MLLKFFLLTLITQVSFASIKPLTTDYCTNYPEGTRQQPDKWKHCCLIHDMTFWAGGTAPQRQDADLALRACIEETGEPLQAKLIYYAVRIASRSPIKYPSKKWNNGWPLRPDYQALSVEDIDSIEGDLEHYDFIHPQIKDDFINLLRSR